MNKKGCPCCIFHFEDLFLPSPSTTQSNEEEEENLELPLPMDPKDVMTAFLSNEKIVLVDSHGHAQLDRDTDETYDTSSFRQEDMTKIQLKSITCSVEPSDWNATLEYSSRSDSILPALGVHPWYIEGLQDNDDWLNELERLLLLHPSAIVGEIGLCKMARWVRQYPDGKSVALEIQRDVFKVR